MVFGPIQIFAFGFPDTAGFEGRIAEELIKLSDAGIIRVMDLLVLVKNEDGSVDATELEDMSEADELMRIEAELAQFHRRRDPGMATPDDDHIRIAILIALR